MSAIPAAQNGTDQRLDVVIGLLTEILDELRQQATRVSIDPPRRTGKLRPLVG